VRKLFTGVISISTSSSFLSYIYLKDFINYLTNTEICVANKQDKLEQ
jgi:hypothetical protein